MNQHIDNAIGGYEDTHPVNTPRVKPALGHPEADSAEYMQSICDTPRTEMVSSIVILHPSTDDWANVLLEAACIYKGTEIITIDKMVKEARPYWLALADAIMRAPHFKPALLTRTTPQSPQQEK